MAASRSSVSTSKGHVERGGGGGGVEVDDRGVFRDDKEGYESLLHHLEHDQRT